jgi:hypothetical protein
MADMEPPAFRPPRFEHRLRTVRVVAETGAEFADFSPYVAAMGPRGEVAFQAGVPDGGSGVFVARRRGPVCVFRSGAAGIAAITSHPVFSSDGAISAHGLDEAGLPVVVQADRGGVRVVRWRDDRVGGELVLGPTSGPQGELVFRARGRDGRERIGRLGPHRQGDTGGLDVVAVACAGEQFQGLPLVDADGAVSFRVDAGFSQSVVTVHRGVVRSLVATGKELSAVGNFPCLSAGGALVFAGADSHGLAGVFVALPGEVPRALVGEGAGFASFRGALVDGVGRVVMYATPPGGQLGIYDGPDPARHRIVGVGDRFEGGEVAEVALNPVSIGGDGALAVRLRLASGRQLIVRVDR